MDVFILDDLFRREHIIDRFESLIWTERYASAGDFELSIYSTRESRNLLVSGTRLAINESSRVMVVETVTDKLDAEGRTLLTVKGPSLEDLLNDRVALNPATPAEWVFNNMLPAAIIRKIFDDICVSGVLSVYDKIPFYTPGNFYPPNNIAEPIDNVSLTVAPTSVYDAIKQLCDIYGLGFRLVRNADKSQLMFNIYTGNDRTSKQTLIPAVIFSPELNNLSDVSYLTSSSAYKNVAFVVAQNGALYVYGNGADPTVSGFQRKVLYVDATNISDPSGPALTAKLQQLGAEQLALNNHLAAFDGEVPYNSQYIYHKHYELGDIVEIRNSDNVTNQMKVTEQIFVSDATGDRSYPTLAVQQLIEPGTWYAEPVAQTWSDLTNVNDTWASRP